MAVAVGLAWPMLAPPARAATAASTGTERGATRVTGFADVEMDFQPMRQLGAARYGGASVGECFALAQRIQNGQPESWVNEFAAAAVRQEEDAQACEEAAMPFGNKLLPGYYFRAPQSGRRQGKTLIIISGYDCTLEETWLAYGRAALERGYHLLLVTGPGQIDTLRGYPGLAFVPEYEVIAHAALDFLLARRGTDPRRVALMGISYGGYFATRMAAHEPRIGALIANSPIRPSSICTPTWPGGQRRGGHRRPLPDGQSGLLRRRLHGLAGRGVLTGVRDALPQPGTPAPQIVSMPWPVSP